MRDRAIEELRGFYRQHRLLPFVGAGASMSLSWDEGGKQTRGPSWPELVDKAAEMLGFEDPSLARVRGNDLQILEYFKIKNGGRLAPLTNWLYAAMRPPDHALRNSPIHSGLANLNLCSQFYTTNYDDFIERSFGLHGRSFRRVAEEGDLTRHADCEIVKFHGDFNAPDRMVVTESDYHRRLSFAEALDMKLQADMLGRVVLFIGYSFSDANVSYLFHRFNAQLSGLPVSRTGVRGYITMRSPSDFEIELFRARNISVIPIEEQSFTEGVAAILLAIAE